MADTRFQFHGDLRDDALLEVVLGATGYGFEPVLHDDPTARLMFFAEVHGITVRIEQVDGAELRHLDWDAPHDWRTEYFAAQEIMGWYGRIPPHELRQRLTPIRIRAAARAARSADLRRGDRRPDVAVEQVYRPYLNFFSVEERDLRFRTHSGDMSPVMNRGGLMVGQATVVLPYDPLRDTVLLIEQFRAPVHMMGDPNPWIWEPVAGLVDPGETPEQAAQREAMEEAGLTIDRLDRAGGMYSSTGASGEYLNLFVGLTRLDQAPQAGGLAAEGEDIRSKIIRYDDLMTGIDAHDYVDMPLVTCALWLARHRVRYRARLRE